MHSETPVSRLKRIFADTAENELRALYAADRMGEPPALAIEFLRREIRPTVLSEDGIVAALGYLDDQTVARVFAGFVRPRILAAFAEVRPS